MSVYSYQVINEIILNDKPNRMQTFNFKESIEEECSLEMLCDRLRQVGGLALTSFPPSLPPSFIFCLLFFFLFLPLPEKWGRIL